VLDLIGLVPGVGEPFDAANGALYAAEGDALSAGLSFASVVPLAGWLAAGSKWVIKAGSGAAEAGAGAAAKGAKNADDTLVGSRGVPVTSKTTWQGQNGFRLDVENPNPGQRAGQIHIHDPNGNKYIFDSDTGTFIGAPNSINSLLDDNFISGLNKGLEQYLGEPRFKVRGA
jgi:filamentous hemagglutinin